MKFRPPLTAAARGIQPLSHQTPRDKKSAVEFKMVTCTYDDKTGDLLMRGRTMDEQSIQVRLTGFEYYFYIQRQTPFSSDAEIEATLRDLERIAKGSQKFTTPVQGDLDSLEDRYGLNEWALRADPSIRAVQRADGVYRTMYGYTPEGQYLDGLVRVYVRESRYARHLAMVAESEQYHNFLEQHHGRDHKMALRTFAAGISPDTLYMIQYGVTRGGFCRLTSYASDPARDLYADAYYTAHFKTLRTIEEPKTPVPLSLFSFDIECIGKPDGRGGMTFPIAKSQKGKPADPVMMIACIQNRYGKEKHLEVHRAKVLVYPHPQAAPMVRRPAHRKLSRAEYDALPAETRNTLSAVYGLVEVEECPSEAHLLRAFVDLFHEWRPDVVTGWNTNQFDYPYLYNRWVELYRESADARDVLQTDRPCFGMAIREKSYARMVTKSSKASGARTFEQVSLPHILYADGQVVFENPSYGVAGMPSYKLDAVASAELKYPGTSRPQRKIKFPLADSMRIWREGGEDMWFFTCYCFVDALLPLQLLDKYDKIGLMFAISNITYCDMTKIYNHGMQVKVISIIYRAAFMYKNGIYLVPDYGRRHLHWPGVFWHPGVRYKVHEYAAQFASSPDGQTNYPGAKVVAPKAGFYPVPVLTDDFKSLYPTSGKNYGTSYDTLLTPETIEKYGIKAHEIVKIPLGPKSLTWCGYPVEDAELAKREGYADSTVMMSYWYGARGTTFLGFIIDLLFTLRADFRRVLGKWARMAFVRFCPGRQTHMHLPVRVSFSTYSHAPDHDVL